MKTIYSWFDPLLNAMQEEGSLLAPWAKVLPAQLKELFEQRPHGDQIRWMEAFENLPEIEVTSVDLNTAAISLASTDLTEATSAQLHEALKGLMPWRKGPFQFFDCFIDTEWHSDWKWDRVSPHISDLKGRTVLDVGCGSGYHMWRMLGEGAHRVVGVDPSRLFLNQFQAFKHYAQQTTEQALNIDLLPFKMEDVPARLKAFDTVFSMGVLYHRKSPIDHMQELKDALKPGGELVLETLVIEGELGQVLMPEDRYAMMRNVWFLPSSETLLLWARRVGFKNCRIVDESVTSLEEQRSTDWMQYQSLVDFLDAEDTSKTAEGYPAPRRATLIAEA